MRNCEIIREIKKKYGPTYFTHGSLKRWVQSLKSSDREFTKRKLGANWIHVWDEENQDETKTPLHLSAGFFLKRHHPKLKRKYLECICECLREKKTHNEIKKVLRNRNGAILVPKSTINHWIRALKSSDRVYASYRLGKDFMSYWNDLNRRPQDKSLRTSKTARIELTQNWNRQHLVQNR